MCVCVCLYACVSICMYMCVYVCVRAPWFVAIAVSI